MTWPGQVAHVVRKDLLRARWLILGWATLVALLTLQLVVPGVRLGIPGAAWAFLLFGLGAGFAAWLVQGDAPHREGAHWPGLPLAPSAVLAAKLFLAFGIGVVVPLLGQLATLVAFPVATSDLPWLLARSSVPMGAGITMGLVLGSVTDGLGKTAALLIGSILVLTLISTVGQYVSPAGPAETQTLGPQWRLLFGPLGALASGIFLLHLYRKGRVARFHRGAGALLALGCIVAALMGTSLYAASEREESLQGLRDLEDLQAGASRLEAIGLRFGDPQNMPTGSDGSYGVATLEVRVVDLQSPSGEEAPLRSWLEPTSLRLVDSRGEVVTSRDARLDWATPLPEASGAQPPIGLRLVRSEAAGILAGELEIEVQGLVVTRALRFLPSLPLVPGAASGVPGTRVTLLEPGGPGSRSGDEPGLRIRLESLIDERDPHPPSFGPGGSLHLWNRVEIRFPTPGSPPIAPGGSSSGSAQARFLLGGIPHIDVTMRTRPPLPPGGAGTVTIGLWEYVRSEPVAFRIPLELMTTWTPGERGPS